MIKLNSKIIQYINLVTKFNLNLCLREREQLISTINETLYKRYKEISLKCSPKANLRRPQ